MHAAEVGGEIGVLPAVGRDVAGHGDTQVASLGLWFYLGAPVLVAGAVHARRWWRVVVAAVFDWQVFFALHVSRSRVQKRGDERLRCREARDPVHVRAHVVLELGERHGEGGRAGALLARGVPHLPAGFGASVLKPHLEEGD